MEPLRSQLARMLDVGEAQLAGAADRYRHLDSLGFHPSPATTEALEMIRDAPRCLDVAAGLGTASIYLAESLGAHCVAVEGHFKIAEIARQRVLLSRQSAKVAVVVGDIRFLPVRTRFDLVIASSIGDLLGDFTSTIASLSHYVAPGGHILVTQTYAVKERVRPQPSEPPAPSGGRVRYHNDCEAGQTDVSQTERYYARSATTLVQVSR